MLKKLTVPEYATLMRISRATAYRRIQKEEIETETINGVLHVILDETQIDLNEIENETIVSELQSQLELQKTQIESLQSKIESQQTHIETLKNEIEFLREELSRANSELSEVRQRTDETIRQMQSDSESGKERSDTIILQLTQQLDQQTKLIEDMRQKEKVGLFQRLFGRKS